VTKLLSINPPAHPADLPATRDAKRQGFTLPCPIAAAGERASERFCTFFTDNIRNKNTRAVTASGRPGSPITWRTGDA
jgi:hypothetical protein